MNYYWCRSEDRPADVERSLQKIKRQEVDEEDEEALRRRDPIGWSRKYLHVRGGAFGSYD